MDSRLVFFYQAPSAWSKRPVSFYFAGSLTTFKSKLKTSLTSSYYVQTMCLCNVFLLGLSVICVHVCMDGSM